MSVRVGVGALPGLYHVSVIYLYDYKRTNFDSVRRGTFPTVIVRKLSSLSGALCLSFLVFCMSETDTEPLFGGSTAWTASRTTAGVQPTFGEAFQ